MASLTKEAASSSSSSDHHNHYTYEVFLSFRGEDTRFGFTDHLHEALCQRGIKTFRDVQLNRGEDISHELNKAIEESRVSVIVFSQNYASSRWCLDELVKILECQKSKGQEVRPLFYKVDPSDVRNQTGTFGEAFAMLDQCKHKDSMDKWRAALKEAANLSGWPLSDGESEVKFIKTIVGELSAQVINPSCELHVAEHPIGLESHRQYINTLLDVEEKNIVRVVGIWGTGGIGKTTIAKDLFNSICHKYEGSCFLADIRSNSTSNSRSIDNQRLEQLQEKLLSNMLRDSTLKVSSVDQGVSFIRTRMRHKKVLLILDDVSHSSQLQKLVPSLDCFGPGSRIIITTRDKRWLPASQVDKVYEVKMLDNDQAMKLFSLSSFERNGPPSDYLELAHRVVSYAGGLPLALTLLGSHLYCRSIEEWEATLDSCKGGDPHIEIRNILKISYDALGEVLKEIFLDIACFFKGQDVNLVRPMLEACYDLKSVTAGIKLLQEKALLRIERDQSADIERIWMHDLIEDMGKDIVRQESPEPGERSRVWSGDDADHVLRNNTGTNKVRGIHFSGGVSKISLNAKSFSKMKNLKYISMYGHKFECSSGDNDFLYNHLSRLLYWPHFPSLVNFHPKELVNFNMPHSCGITRLWEGCKKFTRLTSMILRESVFLTKLPDFSGIPNLKELILSFCQSLVEVPDSVEFLPNLVALKVDSCNDIGTFERKYNLKSVETISIRYCYKFQESPEVACLRSLNLSGTCIKKLHPSITKLIELELLRLLECRNLTILPDHINLLRSLKDFEKCPKLPFQKFQKRWIP